MKAERFQKMITVGVFAGCILGGLLSCVSSKHLGVVPIAIGGSAGFAVGAIGSQSFFANWIDARYRYFEVAFGILGMLVMLAALWILLVKSPQPREVGLGAIGGIAILLVVAINLVVGASAANGWSITSRLIGFIAGFVSLVGNHMNFITRSFWGFVALVALASAWAASHQPRDSHRRV